MTILKPVLYLFNKNMAIRTALLTSKNINLDTDFSKYIETVSEPGVIEGLAVTASSVATGIAWVLCERTNGETIYSLVQNFNAVSISGDGYVIITIPQNIVDNWGGNEDGTGIASIEVVSELPAKNYLLLATISGGTVTDNRNMIKKVWELSTEIDSIFAQLEDLDQRVDKLEAADAIDHLEERALVGENYSLSNTLFKQLTPTLANSTVEANIGDVAANTQVHIQRLGSGTASNQLKLKLKSAGSPTTGLTVEVRKWVKVNVSSSEAYWYGNEVIATGTIAYGNISNSWSEITVTLNNEFWGEEWELLDIVLYQTGSIVNATNYYIMACDSTQWSEGFSYVCVNGTTRTRQKLMPYCVSSGFAQAMLSKVSTSTVVWQGIIKSNHNADSTSMDITTSQYNTIVSNFTINKLVWYEFYCELRPTNPGSFDQWYSFQFSNWTTVLETLSFKHNWNSTYSSWYIEWPNSNVSFKVDCKIVSSTYSWTWKLNNWVLTYYYFWNINISKTVSTRKSKPRELKSIWEKARSTLYGYHIDNTRYTGE